MQKHYDKNPRFLLVRLNLSWTLIGHILVTWLNFNQLEYLILQQ